MKKLSELSNDTLLCVELNSGENWELLDKSGFLYSYTSHRGRLWIAEAENATFSWADVIERFEDDMHEDWAEIVMDDIRATPELVEAEKLINMLLHRHSTYYQGELVENDMREG